MSKVCFDESNCEETKPCRLCHIYWDKEDTTELREAIGVIQAVLNRRSPKVLTLSSEVTLTDSFIEDVLVTAIEGGISYWCSHIEVPIDYQWKGQPTSIGASMAINRGSEVVFHISDSRDRADLNRSYKLTFPKMSSGISKFFLENGVDMDTGNLDSADCDRILQYALFDKATFS